MRSAALVSKDDEDEDPVSSIEVLEMNVTAIRGDLNKLTDEFRVAITRIDNDIKSAVLRLEAEIQKTAESARNDLEKLAARLDVQLQELRGDNKALREKVDRNLEFILAKFEETNRKFDETNRKIDQTNDRIDLTNEKLGALDRKVTEIGTKLTALLWVIGGLGTLITIAVTVGKALRWF